LSWLKNRAWSQQLGRFAGVGILNSVLGYGVIFAAMACGLSPYVSNALGYFVGWLFSYGLNRHWVFSAARPGWGSMLRYAVSFALAYGVNFLVLHGCLRAGWPGVVAQVVAGAAYFLVMFSVSKLWVFKQ
jgi:putative flippase GtrA